MDNEKYYIIWLKKTAAFLSNVKLSEPENCVLKLSGKRSTVGMLLVR